jgi:hypothetical protein
MYGSVAMVRRERFVYDQSMDAEFSAETAASLRDRGLVRVLAQGKHP